MTLEVAICTFKPKGIDAVAAMNLPHVPGVRYVVSWQKSEQAPVPEALLREDVSVHRTDTVGLSNNRNFAFSKCGADVVLIADDDLIYKAEDLLFVKQTFENNEQLDVATFKHSFTHRENEKIYPENVHNLAEPYRFYYVTSFEIAVRLKSIKEKQLKFSALAGIGAPYLSAGEEGLFLFHCIKAKLNCRFFPRVIVAHRGDTTSESRAHEASVIRARGACLRIMRGSFTALTRLPIEASRTHGNYLRALWHLVEGYFYSIKHKDGL
jgi:glycosyltransferase involved in cell wall biosynthesis